MHTVSEYKTEYAAQFKKLNMDWLERYFTPEPYDVEILSNPEKYIINKNGKIFFVLENNNPVGTASLMYNDYGELELTKMAVDDVAKGKGYGNILMETCINEAKKMGVKDLILYSNTKLNPAISLYVKYGFKEIPVEESEYQRCNIKMVKPLSD